MDVNCTLLWLMIDEVLVGLSCHLLIGVWLLLIEVVWLVLGILKQQIIDHDDIVNKVRSWREVMVWVIMRLLFYNIRLQVD